jgi:hypothetical protein
VAGLTIGMYGTYQGSLTEDVHLVPQVKTTNLENRKIITVSSLRGHLIQYENMKIGIDKS